MNDYTYHPMHMHLHAGHQPGASVESHMHNAAALGMHYIRITSHDIRMGPHPLPCKSFDFKKGSLVYEDYPGSWCGWSEQFGAPEVCFDGSGMILSACSQTDEHRLDGYGFKTSAKRHTVSLLSDITLTLGLSCETFGDAHVIIDVTLSQRAPDHLHAHLRYVFGKTQPSDQPHTAELPLSLSPDGIYRLELTKDVQRDGISAVVGGADNAFDSIAVLLETENGGRASCRLTRFEIDTKYSYETVVAKQRKLAEEIGSRYNIKPFVTNEISAAGQHKNCYSTKVPVIDYAAHGYSVTQEQAIEHVKRYGGIFSYNHPFEKYKRSVITPQEHPKIIRRDAEEFIKTKVYGATLMEVGFAAGRDSFTLEEHLQLWDLISLGGVFITGYGDSDSHFSTRNWFDGNNFAAWVAAPADIPFPVGEEHFTDSMKAGRLYTGDPVFLKGAVKLCCGGKPMGAIITAEKAKTFTVSFAADSVEKDSTIRIVVNGEEAHRFYAEEHSDKDGNVRFEFEVSNPLAVNFARVEMYNSDGRCILLTNPIYFVRTDKFSGEIPEERIYPTEKEAEE